MKGWFGDRFGGQFVPETLMAALTELEAAHERACADPAFRSRLEALQRDYSGRPTPLYGARRLGEAWGGRTRVLLKREDLNHTGAHKINNALGQALLAEALGKRRLICETGAGQHGVATATVAALFGMECRVYMGAEDMRRQAPNVQRMRLLGAEVSPVEAGSATLKDATNEALRDWVGSVATTHYIIGSSVGPHPFPTIVRDFQAVIGHETRRQCLEREGRLPDAIVACVGGGSNAIGIFHPFLDDAAVRLVGVEAAGRGVETGLTAATLGVGRPGVLHGSYSYVIQDPHGQIVPTHSISAGLDYPGVGPEHSWLKESGRVEYGSATDAEAVAAFQELARLEGILPALESSHALAHARKLAALPDAPSILVVNLSGRGDKDLAEVASWLAEERS